MQTPVQVVAARSFLESAVKLPKEVRAKVFKTLMLLSQDVRHPSLQTKLIQGAGGSLFECRIDQDARMVYDIHGSELRCWFVGKHDDALRAAGRRQFSDVVDDVASADVIPGDDFVKVDLASLELLSEDL